MTTLTYTTPGLAPFAFSGPNDRAHDCEECLIDTPEVVYAATHLVIDDTWSVDKRMCPAHAQHHLTDGTATHTIALYGEQADKPFSKLDGPYGIPARVLLDVVEPGRALGFESVTGTDFRGFREAGKWHLVWGHSDQHRVSGSSLDTAVRALMREIGANGGTAEIEWEYNGRKKTVTLMPTSERVAERDARDLRTAYEAGLLAEVSHDKDRFGHRGWTVAYRKPGAESFTRLDFDLSWQASTEVAKAVSRALPTGYEVYYVGNAESERDGRTCEDDKGNILISGFDDPSEDVRVPIVDMALPDDFEVRNYPSIGDVYDADQDEDLARHGESEEMRPSYAVVALLTGTGEHPSGEMFTDTYTLLCRGQIIGYVCSVRSTDGSWYRIAATQADLPAAPHHEGVFGYMRSTTEIDIARDLHLGCDVQLRLIEALEMRRLSGVTGDLSWADESTRDAVLASIRLDMLRWAFNTDPQENGFWNQPLDVVEVEPGSDYAGTDDARLHAEGTGSPLAYVVDVRYDSRGARAVYGVSANGAVDLWMN